MNRELGRAFPPEPFIGFAQFSSPNSPPNSGLCGITDHFFSPLYIF